MALSKAAAAQVKRIMRGRPPDDVPKSVINEAEAYIQSDPTRRLAAQRAEATPKTIIPFAGLSKISKQTQQPGGAEFENVQRTKEAIARQQLSLAEQQAISKVEKMRSRIELESQPGFVGPVREIRPVPGPVQPKPFLEKKVVNTFTDKNTRKQIPITEVRFVDVKKGIDRIATEKERVAFEKSTNELKISSEPRPLGEKIGEPIRYASERFTQDLNVGLRESITKPVGRGVGSLSASVGGPRTLEEAKQNIFESSLFIKEESAKLGGRVGGIFGEGIRVSGLAVGKIGGEISEFGVAYASDFTEKPLKHAALYAGGAAFKTVQTGISFAGARFFGVTGLSVAKTTLNVGNLALVGIEGKRIVSGVQSAESPGAFLGSEAAGLTSFGFGLKSAGYIPKVARTDLVLGTTLQEVKQVKALYRSGVIGKETAKGLRAGIDLQFKLRGFEDVPVKLPSTAAIPKDLTIEQQEIVVSVFGEPTAQIFGSQSTRLRGLQELGGDIDLAVLNNRLVAAEAGAKAKLVTPEFDLAIRKESIGFGGDKALDIKSMERVEAFAFKESPVLTPDKIMITKLSEQFSRAISGTLELRKGGKDIGAAILSARGLIKQQALSLSGDKSFLGKLKLRSLRKSEEKLVLLEKGLPDFAKIVEGTPDAKIVSLRERTGFLIEEPEIVLPSISDSSGVGIRSKKGSAYLSLGRGKIKNLPEQPRLKIEKREMEVFGELKEFKKSKKPKAEDFTPSDIGKIKQKPIKISPSVFSPFRPSRIGFPAPSQFGLSSPISQPSTFPSQFGARSVGSSVGVSPSTFGSSSPIRPFIPSIITPNTKISDNGFPRRNSPGGLKLQVTPSRRPTKTFTIFVRRFGQFKPVGTTKDLKKAFAIGREKVSTTLAATFKIKGIKGAKNVGTPKGFRRKGGLFIEKRKFRLSKTPEVEEIQTAKRTKRKRRKK